jgi:plasmid stability protein
MPAVTIRNIPVETHRALKARAAKAGRSAEAEVRAILEEAVRPADRIKVGSWLHERAMEFGGFDLEIKRDQTPARFATFE